MSSPTVVGGGELAEGNVSRGRKKVGGGRARATISLTEQEDIRRKGKGFERSKRGRRRNPTTGIINRN